VPKNNIIIKDNSDVNNIFDNSSISLAEFGRWKIAICDEYYNLFSPSTIVPLLFTINLRQLTDLMIKACYL
jgi:hypothetical protein